MADPIGTDANRLVGRAAELERLLSLAAQARAGRGGALCVEGRPGVGKSALLAALRPPGLHVLRATGVESEIGLPFAGLAELLAPLVGGRADGTGGLSGTRGGPSGARAADLSGAPAADPTDARADGPSGARAPDLSGAPAGDPTDAPAADLLDALPQAQRAALRAALALDAPAGAERVLVLHAVLALLEAAAEQTPLLALVDDVQWLDPASAEAIAFVARRVERLPLALVAVRSLRGEPFEPWPGVPRMTLGDLAPADALALARDGGLAEPVAEALVAAVGGNPLALVEAPGELTAAQRAGGVALPDPLPAGERLRRAYAARVAALPPRTRTALLLVAASADGAAGPLAAALAESPGAAPGAAAAPDAPAAPGTAAAPDAAAAPGTAAAPDAAAAPGAAASALADAIAPAEDARLIAASDARVRFAHPLMRSAVYHAASPSERRAAHRALASAGGEAERVWHLAAAAVAPDEQLAAGLEQLAFEAAGRGAPAVATAAHERAAQLTPDPARAAARTIAAAGTATVAGSPQRARALLDALAPQLDDPLLRADAAFVRGAAILQDGRPMAAHALLEEEAERVVERDPTRAALLLTQACVARLSHGGMEQLAQLAARAHELAPDWARLAPAVLRAEALWGMGDRRAAQELLRAHADALATADAVGPGFEILSVAALCMIYMEDYDDAERLLARLVATARSRGAVSALALPVAVQGALHIRRGDFGASAACGDEALALADDGLEGFVLALALSSCAFVEAHRGEREACREHAGRVLEISARLGLTVASATGEQALGMLELGTGAPAAAIEHLERARAHTARFGARDPTFLYTTADLVDAYVRDGRGADARRLAGELDAAARQTGAAWTTATAARCAALLGPAEEIDAHLAAALAAHARVAQPFELARTQLTVGERLRRSRRRADARPLLATARASFEALGVEPWARRAEQELAAAGAARVRGSRPASVPVLAVTAPPAFDVLTARERSICELVAGGATNREAAAALFVSPRTVEHHLRQAYRKLDVRSRTELALRWRVPG